MDVVSQAALHGLQLLAVCTLIIFLICFTIVPTNENTGFAETNHPIENPWVSGIYKLHVIVHPSGFSS